MVRQHRSKPLSLHTLSVIGGVAATIVVAVPAPASAQSLFDFLFGGDQRGPAPPANMSSYAEPPASVGRIVPPSLGRENVRHEAESSGRAVAYCVRLCDGQHFPLERMANATPVEACNALCPASKTKVFYGSAIDGAVARDGQHYADLGTAYAYRKQMVASCTCNGHSATGLAPYDVSKDPTLRPGDIVATKDGFVAYTGKRGDANGFTPVDAAKVTAELMPGAAPSEHLARNEHLERRTHVARGTTPSPAAVEEESGMIAPSQAPRPVVEITSQSIR